MITMLTAVMLEGNNFWTSGSIPIRAQLVITDIKPTTSNADWNRVRPTLRTVHNSCNTHQRYIQYTTLETQTSITYSTQLFKHTPTLCTVHNSCNTDQHYIQYTTLATQTNITYSTQLFKHTPTLHTVHTSLNTHQHYIQYTPL